jgi:murein DD-endopeptidase MepM/ murein hydrolase activator NlpD
VVNTLNINNGEGNIRPQDSERAQGRLWIPHGVLTGEGDAVYDKALVCSPLGKYVFVKPRASYDIAEFVSVTEDFTGTNTQITSYVFWLGDSSSCGETIIGHDAADPMQAFLTDPEVQMQFALKRQTRGGFFLLGNRQGAGSAAAEIKKIVFDCNLDFIVLGVHQLAGESPELAIVGLRHVITSFRWDFDFRKPILLMFGDGGANVHLVAETDRDSFDSEERSLTEPEALDSTTLLVPLTNAPGTPLLLGDLSLQQLIAEDGAVTDLQQSEIHVLDNTGYLGLNYWPILAFVPNSTGGQSIELTLVNMNRPLAAPYQGITTGALYHPLLVPASGSGCPFNTTRDLSASELNGAETLFEGPFLTGAIKNVTTSAWFWDFDTVKDNSRVRTWTFPRGRLNAMQSNLQYVSDVSAVWSSTPNWVSHPLVGQPFAMEFKLVPRSISTLVTWFPGNDNFGSIPYLMGAGDVTEGWATSFVAFLLSPTATLFQGYSACIPLIPPWAKFDWNDELNQGDDLDHMMLRLGYRFYDNCIPDVGPCDGTGDRAVKWTAGKNQPTVVMSGTPCEGVTSEDISKSTFSLSLKIAPWSMHVQVRNTRMGLATPEGSGGIIGEEEEARHTSNVGMVWPGRQFYIAPIVLPLEFDQLGGRPSGFRDTGTPVFIDMAQRENAQANFGILPMSVLVAMSVVSDKGDFPPMMDVYDETAAHPHLANHLARVDIGPSRIPRASEGGTHGGGGAVPDACVGILSVPFCWPVSDSQPIVISSGYTDTRPTGDHCAIDIVRSGDIEGEDIRACAAGVIFRKAWCAACGFYTEILHTIPPEPSTKTFLSRYLHMNEPGLKEVGDSVTCGEKIGEVGGLGEGSTGPHLHFALYCGSAKGDCQATGIDPCGILPAPANGVFHWAADGSLEEGCSDFVGAEGAICQMFDDVRGDLMIPCPDGVYRRIKDVALAIARCESGLNPCARNCLSIGGSPYSAIGLFQILNPLHIAADVAAGNIASANTHNPFHDCDGDVYCPGLTGNSDYFQILNNIHAALRISGDGIDFSPWSCWRCYPPECVPERYPFLSTLNPPCPP